MAMAMEPDQKPAPSLNNLPYDIQIRILSFLHPMKAFSLASTCRSFSLICRRSSPSTDLWFALCDRRWGSKTQISRWPVIPSRQFYNTLDRLDDIIGFWYYKGESMSGAPSLIFFEWSSSGIIGSTISPSSSSASYSVRKIPFMSISLSRDGETLSYVLPDNPVSFAINRNRLIIEEMFENSMGSDKASRRSSWGSMSFSKVYHHSPSLTGHLSGLWKGITEDMNLEFFLVIDDGCGYSNCQKLLNKCIYFSGFLTDGDIKTPPFSIEEEEMFDMREHVRSEDSAHSGMCSEIVTQIRFFHSFKPGRVWQYKDGTFGFGNVESNFIVDMKLISKDGYHLLDLIE